MRRGAAPPRAGNRADGHDLASGLDQDFRARTTDCERAAIEEEQIRRGVDPAQSAIERKRRERKRRLETLRQHHLKDVAGGDVFLGLQHHAPEIFRRGVRARYHVQRPGLLSTLPGKRGREGWGRLVERPVERVDDRRQTFDRARQRRVGRHSRLRPHRRDDRDRILHCIEGDHQRRANEDRVRNADRIGRRRRERILHLPHHVVAEIAEDAGRHRRQRIRQRDAALGDQGAQRLQRRRGRRRERFRIMLRRAVDLRLRAVAAKDDVRLKPDDRIAAADLATLDRFKQKAHWHRSFGNELLGRAPAILRKAETGVSRSATNVVQTTCAAPAA